jgi:hypothetical protein
LRDEPELILSVSDLKLFNFFLNGSRGVRSLYNSHEGLHREATPEDTPTL